MSTLRSALLAALASASLAYATPPPGNPAAGKTVFATYCQICHGPKGRGDGPGAAALNPKPANFSSAAVEKIPDDIRLQAVTGGGATVGKSPQMPAFKDVLTPEQIRDVLAFIRQNLHS